MGKMKGTIEEQFFGETHRVGKTRAAHARETKFYQTNPFAAKTRACHSITSAKTVSNRHQKRTQFVAPTSLAEIGGGGSLRLDLGLRTLDKCQPIPTCAAGGIPEPKTRNQKLPSLVSDKSHPVAVNRALKNYFCSLTQ